MKNYVIYWLTTVIIVMAAVDRGVVMVGEVVQCISSSMGEEGILNISIRSWILWRARMVLFAGKELQWMLFGVDFFGCLMYYSVMR